MIDTLKRILPAGVRRAVRPLTLAYQRRTQQANTLRLFGNFIAPGDLVFDIGANTGRMTEVFLSLGAKVCAVEPQPACIDKLHASLGHNKRVTILEMGVAAECGRQTINICGDIDEVSSFREDWDKSHYAARFTGQAEVNMTNLDSLIRLFGLPDFCKIDVEGYEFQVFKGLTRPIPHLCFEFHRHHWADAWACMLELKRVGAYRFNFVSHEAQNLQLRDWMPGPEILDWLGHQQVASGDIFARLAQ